MMAAILAEMQFTRAEMTGSELVSTMPGVIAHLSEEITRRIRIRGAADASYFRERKSLLAVLAAAGWPS